MGVEMSETLSAGSARDRKVACRKCNRTVLVVLCEQSDGTMREVHVDPEIEEAVGYPGGDVVMRVRRTHAPSCVRYQTEDAQRAERRLRARAGRKK